MATDITDPHVLVFLMNYKYGGQKQDGALRRADTEGYVSGHRIGDDRSTALETFKVLDALASLSVRKSKTQVVALAMQLDSEKKEITFTVAENKEVSEGIERYLKKIWEGLRELADFYESSLPKGSEYDEVNLHLRRNIYRTVFEHTMPKQLARVKTYLDPLAEFIAEVSEYPQVWEANREFAENILLLVAELDVIGDFLKDLRNGKTPTDHEWRETLSLAILVSDKAASVLEEGDHYACEALATELNKLKGMSIPPPIKLLQKLA